MEKKIYCLIIFILLNSCANPKYFSSFSNKISGPEDYIYTEKDNFPWWDMDISNINDAIPMVHNGAYKISPYIVKGQKYIPIKDSLNYKEEGYASWYGTRFHGNKTANGEIYDLYKMTAAHKTLPLPSYVKVTNKENNKSVIVRVNDRGPFHSERIIDLSYVAAKKLDFAHKGFTNVLIEAINPLAWRNENYDPNNEKLTNLEDKYKTPELANATSEQRRFTQNIWPVSPNSSLKNSNYCFAQLYNTSDEDNKCIIYYKYLSEELE